MRFASRSTQAAILLAVSVGTSQAGEHLTLAEAMHRALVANPAIKSREAELQKELLGIDIARGQHWPKVDFDASYTRYAYPSLVTPIRQPGVFPPLDRDVSNVGIALSLPLYAGGKLVAGESLAENSREAAAQALRGAGQDLLFNVTSTFTKALHLRDLQKSAGARVKTLETEETHISQRLAQGRVAKLELIRLQTQLSQARHDLLTIEQGERDALSILAALLGESRKLPPLANIGAMQVALPNSREDVLAKAISLRPELLRAQALAKAAADKVNIAKGEQRPQVNFLARAQETAGGNWKGYDDAQIGIQLTIPLFDGWIRKNRVAQANLERRKSELLIEETTNELASDVEQAHGAVTESRARLEVAKQGESEAEEALRIETARYQAGESTITDLLGADAALWSARVNRLQAGYDATASQARLLRAIGELSPESFKP
jgi:outer membrane protein TolC